MYWWEPQLLISRAAIGTVVYYGAALLNMSVIKHTGIDFSFVDFIVKPAISVTVMGLIVHYSYGYCLVRRKAISLAGLIHLIGVVVYVVMLPITRAITQEDLEALPRAEPLPDF